MDASPDVEYEYQGQVWVLSRAMVELQVALLKARAALDAATEPDQLEGARELERRLVLEKFSAAAAWRETFEAYDRWRVDEALKHYARTYM